MSKDSAIIVENLAKSYIIGHSKRRQPYELLSEKVLGFGRQMIRGANALLKGQPLLMGDETEEFWALQDINFEIKKGEVVGIIGHNGAGKSTLLKVLSRITEPTRGRVTLRGGVASLLEVGTGFHPELSGRENIYLNGTILGMRRAEIHQKFDEIVEFAEVGRFLDTPVKRYSSGMYVRLAFSVAAHLQPEILIVDEVLAVGDSNFQRKCLGKMQDVSQSEGKTILFVSHRMDSISTLTDRCIVLKGGKVHYDGATAQAIQAYLARGEAGTDLVYRAVRTDPRLPKITKVELHTSEGPGLQAANKPMEIEVELDFPEPTPGACLSVQIVNQYDQMATHMWIHGPITPFGHQGGKVRLMCEVPKTRLNVGDYTLRFDFSGPPIDFAYESVERVCPFQVVKLDETHLWGWRSEDCVYHEENAWRIQQLD